MSLLLSCSTKAASGAASAPAVDKTEKAATKMDEGCMESAEENLAHRTSELELTGFEVQTENLPGQTKKRNSSRQQTDSNKTSCPGTVQKANRGLNTTSDHKTIKSATPVSKSSSAQRLRSAAQDSTSSSGASVGDGPLAALLPQVYWFSQRYSYPALGRACLSLLLGCQDCPRPFLSSSLAGDCLCRLAREADCIETLKQDLLSLATVALS